MLDYVPPFQTRVAHKPLWPRDAGGNITHVAITKLDSPYEIVQLVRVMENTKKAEETALMTARFTVRIHNNAVRHRIREHARARITKQRLKKEAQQCLAKPSTL